jgi:hypothetical protein
MAAIDASGYAQINGTGTGRRGMSQEQGTVGTAMSSAFMQL